MPLAQRILNVTFSGPQLGAETIPLDASVDMKVRVSKGALAVQNTCEIVVSNLSKTLRDSLLSQFTAWNKRVIESPQAGGAPTQQSYVNVSVVAGYSVVASQQLAATQARQGQATGQLGTNTAPIFSGQVVLVEPVGELPTMAVKITCYTQQVNKLNYLTQTPGGQITFKAYVEWAAQQMGLNVNCNTSYDNRVITNPAASVETADALLVDIQNLYHPDVAAFVDSATNTLVVRDVNAIVNNYNNVTVNEFIGMPLWDQWGPVFTCLFNPAILLTSAVQLESVMNPSLGTAQAPKQYVVYALDYNLTSRDTPFDMKVWCAPPA